MTNFNLWSESNTEAKEFLRPYFDLRNWNSLSYEDKSLIWKHLNFYFFNENIVSDYDLMGRVCGKHYNFFGEYNDRIDKQERIKNSVSLLNYLYKAKSYAINYLNDPTLNAACTDFFQIFMEEDGSVVIELLSLYCKILIPETGETEYENVKWRHFDKFAEDLNEVFLHFYLNLTLTRLGFIPRQENKIFEEMYIPVLESFSNKKWEKVNQILSDSFKNYRKGTPEGYSNCVTHTVSAVQAFLQILVNGDVGMGDISWLIPEARKKQLIPGDLFTEKIFSNIQSVLMRERQETGIAHPKNDYATEKNSRLVLNLSMVFFQHCLQK